MEVYLYQWTTYFREGPDPIFRTMRSTAYSCSFAVETSEKLHLVDGDTGSSEAKYICDCARIWRGCDKRVEFGTVGAWDTRSMDTV